MIDNTLQNNTLQNNTMADNQRQVEQNGGLDDLRLTDEELDGINGGCGPFHKDDRGSSTIGGGGGFINNHNETVVSDEDNDQNAIVDLEVPNTDEVKGGPIYMQVEGVKGRVTAAGYEKQIELP
jgi:hypothetical protein